MNKNIFGIGIVLAVLVAFAAPAMAGPNTVYFTNQSGDTSPGGISYLEIWLNLTDVTGSSGDPDFGLSSLMVNFSFDPNIGDVIACNAPPAGHPWQYDWYSQDKWADDSWYFIASRVWPPDPGPYGLAPGIYQLANITIKGVSPGVMDLEFEIDHGSGPRYSDMIDIFAYSMPNQTWEKSTWTCIGTAETFENPLVTGWNLVSLPLTADDMTAGTVLASIIGSYDSVMRYDSLAYSYVVVDDTDTMENGVGYFVNVTTAEVTWSYDGTAYTSMNSTLSTGLNCVGWMNETGSTLPGALNSIAVDYRYVARWNAGTQSYEVYLPGAPAAFSDFEAMDRGVGYFIAATAGCTLTSP